MPGQLAAARQMMALVPRQSEARAVWSSTGLQAADEALVVEKELAVPSALCGLLRRWGKRKSGGQQGIEPWAPSTLKKDHTTRPLSQSYVVCRFGHIVHTSAAPCPPASQPRAGWDGRPGGDPSSRNLMHADRYAWLLGCVACSHAVAIRVIPRVSARPGWSVWRETCMAGAWRGVGEPGSAQAVVRSPRA